MTLGHRALRRVWGTGRRAQSRGISSTTVAPRLWVMSVTESTAGALLSSSTSSVEIEHRRRREVPRRERWVRPCRVGVEAVVGDRLEHHAAAELLRERGADVVGLLPEARQRGLVVRLRHPEGDDAVGDRERLRLAHRGACRRRQLGEDLGPGHDHVVDVDLADGSRRLGLGLGRRSGGATGSGCGAIPTRGHRRHRVLATQLGERPRPARRAGGAAAVGDRRLRPTRRRRRASPPRSSRSTRSASACSGVPASRRASRTSAISSTRRGSAASVPRMSTTACPSVSSVRTSIGAPTCSPSAPSACLVVVGEVDAHPSARRREQERVAHGRQQVLGEAARLVPGVEQLAERDEGTGDVFVGDRAQDREPAVERGAAEQRVHLLDVDPRRARWPGRAATASRASSRRPPGRSPRAPRGSASTPSFSQTSAR